MSSELKVTPQAWAQLRELTNELAWPNWSEQKWLAGVKRILGRKDIECEHKYGPTWASVTIRVKD